MAIKEISKSAIVWLAFLDGWCDINKGKTMEMARLEKMPMADDRTRKTCVRIYDTMGKRKAKLYAYSKGLDGRLL